MELGALEQSLKKDGVAPVWVVMGEESWLVEAAIARILAAAVPRADDPMAVTRIDLAEGKRGAKDVVAACRSIGLFASRVAIVVRAAELLDKRAEDREEIGRYCEAPVREATLILKATELDGRSALMKRVKKNGRILSYPLMKPRDAQKWLTERARAVGQRIDYDAAGRIVELVGSSLLMLDTVLTQLSLYVGPGKAISALDVEEALAATRAHSVFELVDAIGAQSARDAIGHLSAMLEQRESPLGILAMIVRHFRQLVEAQAVVARGGGPDEVQSRLKLSHPFIAQKLAQQVERFDHTMLRTAFEAFFRAELELKSSRVDPVLRLEGLIFRLAEPRARGGRGGGQRGDPRARNP